MTDTRYLLENIRTKKQYDLRGTVQVGRKVPDDQIVVNDEAVSRHHASLTVVEGVVYLQDEGSRNGTYVNDQKISTKISLAAGDHLKFGAKGDSGAEFEFRVEKDDETVSAQPAAGEHTVEAPEDLQARLRRLEAALARPPPPDIREACLVVVTEGQSDRIIPLVADTSKVQNWSIGRGRDCAIRFDAKDVSEHHATIERSGAQWCLLNLFATNGAYVNGSMVARRYLESGDCIQLSTIDCRFYLPGKRRSDAQRGGKKPSQAKTIIIWLTISFLVTLLAAYVVHQVLFSAAGR